MSVAVAVRKGSQIAIAADTQENFGDQKVPRGNHDASKIVRTGRSYVAMAGWGVYDNVLRDHLARGRPPRLRSEREVFTFFLALWRQMRRRYSFVNDQANEDDPTPFADLDSSFLIANPGGIFHVSGNISVLGFQQYFAIGSGAPYALGALHALYDQRLDAAALARRACEVATAFDVYSGGTLHVFRV